VKVQQSLYRPGLTLTVPGSWGTKISSQLAQIGLVTTVILHEGCVPSIIWSLQFLAKRYNSDCSSDHMNFVSPHNGQFLLLEWITWLLVPINHHRGRGLAKARREITHSRVNRPLPWRRKIQLPCIRNLDYKCTFWKSPHIIFIVLRITSRLIKIKMRLTRHVARTN